MPRSPEGTPRRSPLAKAKDVLRRVDRKAIKGVVGAGIALGSVSMEAALPASASVKSKAPEAVTASPAQNFRLKSPDQVIKSVQAELAAKDSKPKKDKKEAQGVTTTTREEQMETMEKQLKTVVSNIEKDHSLSQEEFLAWINDGNQFTQDLAGEGVLFDNPAVFDGDTAIDPIRNMIYYHFGTDQLKEVQPQPNLALLTGTSSYRGAPDSQFYDTLLLYDGYVEVPLTQTASGTALVSFGTQIWGNGEKVTLAWIDAINDPDDARLQNEGLTVISQTPSYVTEFDKTKLGIKDVEARDITRLPYAEYKKILRANRNKPIETTFFGNYWVRNTTTPFFSFQDIGIDGVNFYSSFASHWAIFDAWQNQDSAGFKASVSNAVKNGVAIEAGDDYEAQVKSVIGGLTNMDEAFKRLPFGLTSILSEATSPHSDSSVSTAGKKA